jgi:hypothetical protein
VAGCRLREIKAVLQRGQHAKLVLSAPTLLDAKPQLRGHSDRDRLSMRQAVVAGRFQGMTNGVSEVQQHAFATLVGIHLDQSHFLLGRLPDHHWLTEYLRHVVELLYQFEQLPGAHQCDLDYLYHAVRQSGFR